MTAIWHVLEPLLVLLGVLYVLWHVVDRVEKFALAWIGNGARADWAEYVLRRLSDTLRDPATSDAEREAVWALTDQALHRPAADVEGRAS